MCLCCGCVCMYVCMYVCVCLFVCLYVCLYACMYVCVYVCAVDAEVFVCVRVRLYVPACVRMCVRVREEAWLTTIRKTLTSARPSGGWSKIRSKLCFHLSARKRKLFAKKKILKHPEYVWTKIASVAFLWHANSPNHSRRKWLSGVVRNDCSVNFYLLSIAKLSTLYDISGGRQNWRWSLLVKALLGSGE